MLRLVENFSAFLLEPGGSTFLILDSALIASCAFQVFWEGVAK
jgi:hypothetical protein